MSTTTLRSEGAGAFAPELTPEGAEAGLAELADDPAADDGDVGELAPPDAADDLSG
jgi:hypothetical protein